jgi:hypothetical protein
MNDLCVIRERVRVYRTELRVDGRYCDVFKYLSSSLSLDCWTQDQLNIVTNVRHERI